MSTFSGWRTGLGTPVNQRTGRRHTYRSRIWRSATFRLRMPPPTGVVSGPLIPTRYSLKQSTVSSGNQLPVRLKAFSPASTSCQAIRRSPPYALSTAASNTRWAVLQISGPVPSPSIKGTTGWSGTLSTARSSMVMCFPPAGGFNAMSLSSSSVRFPSLDADVICPIRPGSPGTLRRKHAAPPVRRPKAPVRSLPRCPRCPASRALPRRRPAARTRLPASPRRAARDSCPSGRIPPSGRRRPPVRSTRCPS